MEAASLSRLMRVVAAGSHEDRIALSRLDPGSREFFSDALSSVARYADHAADTIRAHVAISVLIRRLWTLVPPAILEGAAPNFGNLARDALASRYRPEDFGANDVGHLSIIFKRIRNGIRHGRRSTSLDLELESHRELLCCQQNRCNHCLYEFGLEMYRYAVEEDDVPAEPYISMADEVVLSTIFRKPELDHIIPILLGGDGGANWQILCRSCNAGKSDLLSYFFNYSSRRHSRPSDLFELSAGKRYAVIGEARANEVVATTEHDGRWYRVFRRNNAGFCNAENLIARYC
jgi:hypothetical protein